MNDEKNENNCSVCGGTGVSKPDLQDVSDIGDGEIQYQPIECQRCKGSGKEPI
ncbi:hypothetical protein [Salinivibrio sp. AR647]|uniref:hypothetical protein n=1 Tax=Salinivibrio sp. AR647 TaxID=1909438 RepID=UPI0013017AF6|nr:hypothetical protein [Salinivibrio sp. AR647]